MNPLKLYSHIVAEGLAVAANSKRMFILASITLLTAMPWSQGTASAQPSGAKPLSDDAVIARGKVILSDKCARCHAIERSGTSPLQAAPAFRDLHKKYAISTIAEALAEGIVTGHPDMPSTPFVQDDIDAIIGYIESLSR